MSIPIAEVSEEVIEAARQYQRRPGRPTRSVRAFFGALAVRRPPGAPAATGDEAAAHDASAFSLFRREPVSEEDERAASRLASAFGGTEHGSNGADEPSAFCSTMCSEGLRRPRRASRSRPRPSPSISSSLVSQNQRRA